MGKQLYLTPQALYAEIRKAQDLQQPTVELCQMFRMIATNMLRGARFHGYAADMKEDLVSAALEKCLKSYRNITAEHADSCFSYMTLACQCAFYSFLKKHYRHANLMRELRDNQIAAYAEVDPIGAKRMRDYTREI